MTSQPPQRHLFYSSSQSTSYISHFKTQNTARLEEPQRFPSSITSVFLIRNLQSKSSSAHTTSKATYVPKYVPSPQSSHTGTKRYQQGKMSTSKAEIIESRRQNLPLPEDPPTAPDWQSASSKGPSDGVGSGRVQNTRDDDALRDPATSESSVRADGEALKKHAEKPNDEMGMK